MDRPALKLRRFLERQGLQVESLVRSGGGHYKAIVINHHGHKRIVILPASPSDHRWEHNKRSEIRNLFREAEEKAHLGH